MDKSTSKILKRAVQIVQSFLQDNYRVRINFTFGATGFVKLMHTTNGSTICIYTEERQITIVKDGKIVKTESC